MAAVTLWLVGALVLPLVLWLWQRGAPARARLARCGEQIPGPRLLPIIGNSLEFGILEFTAHLDHARMLCKKYGRLIRLWAGPFLVVIVVDPSDIEVLLSSFKYIKKSFTYSFFHKWLGEGLLTSWGDRWHKHRKLITPTFHFKILEQFVDVFNKHGDVLISKLKESKKNEYVDVCSYIDLYTQDVICETAMGVELNCQKSGRSTVYLKAVKETCHVLAKRSIKPWYYPEFTFQLSSYGRIQKKNLSILHSMTNEVIAERKRQLQTHPTDPGSEISSQIGKKKMPFLDLLLLSAKGDDDLSDTDIREEVDTFMFEGHDTTASAISFALYELARHPEIQNKIYTELKEVEDNGKLNPSFDVLNELKYLEQVIKETLRLYPSVPMFMREITEDLHLPKRNIVVPPGTWMVISPLLQHRDPDIFPCPDVFNPDNFLPEAVQKRHPFAYIPFSAGPRNCIGQKFAMLELKSVLSKIIWNFHLKIDPNFKLKLLPEISLKWVEGIPISFNPRIK